MPATRRTRLLALITVLTSLALGLAVAEWALRWQRDAIAHSDHMDPGLIRYDPLLGWRLTPGWEGAHRHHDFQVRYRINADGHRGPRATPYPSRGTTVIGDSFTFGLGVNEGETFIDRLNADLDRPRYFNYGIPGYSTDQELLLAEGLDPAALGQVLLVVYLGNDLVDNLRPYPLQAEHAKPYFQLRDGRLALRNTPVPRARKPAAARRRTLAALILDEPLRPGLLGRLELFRRLGLFQPRPRVDEARLAQRLTPALTLFDALVARLQALVRRHGGRLAIALLAGRSYVSEPRSLSARYQGYLLRETRQRLQARGLPVIDLASALRQDAQRLGAPLYHPHEGHLTPLGHHQVARHLARALQGQRP